MTAEAPRAPWALRGEAVVAVVGGGAGRGSGGGGRGSSGRLPAGVRPMRGPALVIGVRYTESPVGPYVELSMWEPGRLGLRPGWCATAVVVSEAAAKVGYRLNWGLPAELGDLVWSGSVGPGSDSGGPVVRWVDGGVELRARCGSVAFPVVLPMRGAQGRGDGPVLVPRRLAALARPARVHVAVTGPGEDEAGPGWGWSVGEHRGLVASAARVLMRPARHPSGLLSSFRAPLRAAEPRLSYRLEAAAEALQ